MKRNLILIICFLTVNSCTVTKVVNSSFVENILLKNPTFWSLDDANTLIKFYTIDNVGNQLFDSSPMNQKVLIRATLLNEYSLSAMARKEIIEKRLDDSLFHTIINNYLKSYTNMVYDKLTNKYFEVDSNFSNGYSFKLFMENISNPFEPIFLEDGYSYFFLENMNGEFSRVTEVTGLFVEDYLQLDGYLDVVITFSPFSSIGKRLFNSNTLNESYKLIFNGLQEDPIIVQWQLR
jgi:hypothetical protein